jgi:hypothetical protein
LALLNAGNNIAAKIAMTAMTTNSSIKVKATFFRFDCFARFTCESRCYLKGINAHVTFWKHFRIWRKDFTCLPFSANAECGYNTAAFTSDFI